MCDDPEWESALTVEYHHFLGEDEETVAAARPFLAPSRRTTSLASWVGAYALSPLVRLGFAAEAVGAYRQVARWSTPPQGDSWNWGKQIKFLALTDNTSPRCGRSRGGCPACCARPTRSAG